jgi:hypothetical protein
MPDFESFENKLDKWFGRSFHDLPSDLRRLVIPSFLPFGWDNLSPAQRRSLASQYDYQNDPATESHQEFWFNFEVKRQEIEGQLVEWELIASPTASDLKQKEIRIAELKQELAHRERLKELLMQRNFPRYTKTEEEGAGLPKPEKLIGLPLALSSLHERLNATQEEIAAWVYLTETGGGLRAYCPRRHPEEFQRFYFNPNMDRNYISLLFDCWFDEQEIATFTPKKRFISGAMCLKYLSKFNDSEHIKLFPKLIQERKITDLHPIAGTTMASLPSDTSLPDVESGLFVIEEVEKALTELGLAKTGVLSPQLVRREIESPEERGARLWVWYREELAIKTAGALKRTAKREGITRQTLKAILDRYLPPLPN